MKSLEIRYDLLFLFDETSRHISLFPSLSKEKIYAAKLHAGGVLALSRVGQEADILLRAGHGMLTIMDGIGSYVASASRKGASKVSL